MHKLNIGICLHLVNTKYTCHWFVSYILLLQEMMVCQEAMMVSQFWIFFLYLNQVRRCVFQTPVSKSLAGTCCHPHPSWVTSVSRDRVRGLFVTCQFAIVWLPRWYHCRCCHRNTILQPQSGCLHLDARRGLIEVTDQNKRDKREVERSRGLYGGKTEDFGREAGRRWRCCVDASGLG